MNRRTLYAFYTFVGIFSILAIGFLLVNVIRSISDHAVRVNREIAIKVRERRAAEKYCRDAKWVWFEIKHGKSENQFICIPPTPRSSL